MQWGRDADWLEEVFEGEEQPEALKSRVDPMFGSHDILRAFWECHTDRQIGMSHGPIPSRAINEYAERCGYFEDDYTFLARMIRALDDVYLTYIAEQSKADTKRQGKG